MNAPAAVFSDDRRYRYLLRRRIGGSRKRALFVMLNPSTADETRDDPTIRRCIGFARRWGFGALEVVNLFALRTPYPRALRQHADPVGARNDCHIRAALRRADTTILAWGAHGVYLNRGDEVRRMALDITMPYCFGATKSGQPKHPLHLRGDSALIPLTS